jgi:DNA polymerase-3 subunit gamma/tau
MNARHNLARLWRSTTFDELVGQPLAVKLIKNSLYKGMFFPVYLLAGQRGCGKTTMGRLFATALNCQKLPDFQKEPHVHQLPCRTCSSCQLMQQANHPDFTELDAASHTGVETIRLLIENASYLPVVGRFKVYLIDEAHMLSRAAFNALLKLLEEPPMSALFMLATTDMHKIPDTVRSRCFQVFFDPIPHDALTSHLQKVCDAEQCAYDEEGLAHIVRQAEGSARDALNILETVRLAEEKVTAEAVKKVLKIPDQSGAATIMLAVVDNQPATLAALYQQLTAQANPQALWRLIAAELHHGLQAHLLKSCTAACAEHHQRRTAHWWLEATTRWYDYESTVIRSSAPYDLMLAQLLFLATFEPVATKQAAGGGHVPQGKAAGAVRETSASPTSSQMVTQSPSPSAAAQAASADTPWQAFLAALEAESGDPLLHSSFRQGIPRLDDTGQLTVSFPRGKQFFQDWLEPERATWFALLTTCWPAVNAVAIDFSLQVEHTAAAQGQEVRRSYPVKPSSGAQAAPAPRSPAGASLSARRSASPQPVLQQEGKGRRIDVSDKAAWPTVNAVLTHFPGIVIEDPHSL